MKWIMVRRISAIAFALAALLVLGCSEDPTEPKTTPAPRYPETTSREIVIDNLLLSYQDRNIEQFAKLLHPDYVWYNQPGMTPEYYTRSEDSLITGNMFDAVLHVHADEAMWLDRLVLWIYQTAPQAEWYSVADIAGVPCEDCWETTRAYSITLVMSSGAMTIIGSDMVKFIVAPVESDGATVYRILRCDDLNN